MWVIGILYIWFIAFAITEDFWGATLLVGIFYSLIWTGSEIKKAIEKHRENVRDRAANDLFLELGINPDGFIEEYKNKIKQIEVEEKGEEKKLIYRYTKKQRYSELQKKCPSCEKGYLRVRVGKFGKFLGCSNYPECKHTINLQKAKLEYKSEMTKGFVEDLEKAYS